MTDENNIGIVDDPNIPNAEKKILQSDPNTITCYMPRKLNINYLGERVLKLGALCYGISVRGSDHKVMITYNINPDGLHEDHFFECANSMVPAKVYEMFQKKLSTDIMRLDNMMLNLTTNKGKLNTLFNFAEESRKLECSELSEEVFEYTEADAHEDKKLEALKANKQVHKLTQGQAKGRAKKKAAKVVKKKSRRR